MSRYIDADALMAELQKDADAFDDEAEDARKNSRNYTDGDLYSVMGRADGIRDAMMEVYDAPSIDIVFCKDCKLGGTEDCPMDEIDDEYFCNFGERESE